MSNNCYIKDKKGQRLIVDFEFSDDICIASCQHDSTTDRESGMDEKQALEKICTVLRVKYGLDYSPE